MKRRVWNVASVLCAVGLLAVLALWGLSYFRVLGLSNSLFRGSQSRGDSGIWSTGGRVLLDTTRHTEVSRIPSWRGATFSIAPYVAQPQFVDQPSVTRWHALGFRVAQWVSTAGDGTLVEFAAVTVPYWALAAALSLLPLWAMWRSATTRRLRLSGRCEYCGYDLRATPGTCPECGKQAAARDAVTA